MEDQFPARAKILLAEDDQTLGFLLKEYLSTQNFSVDWAEDGVAALRLFNANEYDLCILDVMMPALDGFTVAELFRNRKPDHPIIFLTAKSMHKDVEKGFKAGADDYIKKPVDEEELVARINAVLKRSSGSRSISEQSFSVFQIGKYIFDSNRFLLKYKDEEKELTEMESSLLKLLCEKKGSLVQREYVLQKMWGKNDFNSRKSMDVFISRLRKYLSKDENITIVNVHGSGFVLEVGKDRK
ncbi:MAG TPA: response regulator transcription factor [Bacteroidetes bacterium]|nr:response regulator transcription factor [Bacteroidota bacterium]